MRCSRAGVARDPGAAGKVVHSIRLDDALMLRTT